MILQTLILRGGLCLVRIETCCALAVIFTSMLNPGVGVLSPSAIIVARCQMHETQRFNEIKPMSRTLTTTQAALLLIRPLLGISLSWFLLDFVFYSEQT